MAQFHSSVLCLPMICLGWRKSVINRSHVFYCPVEYGLKIPRCVVQIYFSKIILTVSKMHCFEEKNNKAFYSEHGLWSIKSFSSIKIGISLSLLCKMSRCCNSKKQKQKHSSSNRKYSFCLSLQWHWQMTRKLLPVIVKLFFHIFVLRIWHVYNSSLIVC